MRLGARRPFERVSLSQQFLLIGAAVLVVGMGVIGSWLSRQIENNTINRAASIAAAYVESILATQLRDWPDVELAGSKTHAVLDRVFVEGPLRRKVVRFKLWDTDGDIVYSSDRTQVGRRFPVEGLLAAAFTGTVQARISNLDGPDNHPERALWPQLLEVYVPVRSGADGKIIAVAEFYHSIENLSRDIRSAQQSSWAFVAVATIAIFLSLLGFVRRADATILDQQRDLRHQLQDLRAALEENEHMRRQLHEAGARTTALNEQFLHRIAADLHDGPAQKIAFALMRFDELAGAGGALPPEEVANGQRKVHDVLRSTLDDVRNIAAGVAVPGIANLSLADTARRAVRDCERQFAMTVESEIDAALDQAPLAVKFTAYRLLQESLANSRRHAGGSVPRVRVSQDDGQALIEITDQGAGFDPATAATSGRLGLAFMRERVRLLGGVFEVHSAVGCGTRIRARLPLSADEMTHA